MIKVYIEKEKAGIEDSLLSFKKGIAYEKLNRRVEGESAFKEAAFFGKPEQWQKWFSKAFVDLYHNEYKEAIVNFDKALQLGGPYAQISLIKGFLMYEEKNYSEACKEFYKAINADSQLVKSHPEIYVYNANIKDKTGNSKQSLEELNHYVTQEPSYYLGYYNRGKYYYLQKQYDLAINDFSKAISVMEDIPQASSERESIYAYLVKAYSDSGRKLEAIKTLDKMIKLYRNTNYYLIRSVIKSDLNLSYKEVLQDINFAIALDADNGYYYFMRGMYRQKYNTDKTEICPDLIKAIQLGVPSEVKLIKESICGK